jgi:hypothetical protein
MKSTCKLWKKNKPINEHEQKKQELKETRKIKVLKIILEKAAQLERAREKFTKKIYNE